MQLLGLAFLQFGKHFDSRHLSFSWMKGLRSNFSFRRKTLTCVYFVNLNYRFLFIIDSLPCYLLMVFGCYCLGKLGVDLILFNDYPLEVKKLEEVQ